INCCGRRSAIDSCGGSWGRFCSGRTAGVGSWGLLRCRNQSPAFARLSPRSTPNTRAPASSPASTLATSLRERGGRLVTDGLEIDRAIVHDEVTGALNRYPRRATVSINAGLSEESPSASRRRAIALYKP